MKDDSLKKVTGKRRRASTTAFLYPSVTSDLV
jgi:hypothetical protein